jgi:hypothetical protein
VAKVVLFFDMTKLFATKSAFFRRLVQLFYAKSGHNWNKEGNFAVHNTKKQRTISPLPVE